jgi:photosystem II stability/assembly factor-like uncharacterized protein
LYIFNGSIWYRIRIDSPDALYAISGSSDTNVFAVGANGTIVHYNGTTATVMPSGVQMDLNGVWVANSTRAYAVGLNGTVLQYDGQHWTAMDGGVTEDLNAVWGAGPNDIFAGGDSGAMTHFNGTRWERQETDPATGSIISIWGSSGRNAYAVTNNGNTGKLLRYQPVI